MYIMHMFIQLSTLHAQAESVHCGGTRLGSTLAATVFGVISVGDCIDIHVQCGILSAMSHSLSRILSSLSQTFLTLTIICPILISMSLTTSIRVMNWLKMLITCKIRMSMLFITCPMLVTCETSTPVSVKKEIECQKNAVVAFCS